MNRIPVWYLSEAGKAAVKHRAELLRAYLQSQRAARVREELAEVLATPSRAENGGRTGSKPGMLQDDSREFSKWLAERLDAGQRAREAAHILALDRAAWKAAPRRFTGQAITGFGDLS